MQERSTRYVPGFRARAMASLGTATGVVALPASGLALIYWGPSSRVDFTHYFLSPAVPVVFLAAAVGASLGAQLYEWFGARASAYSVARVASGAVVGSAALLVASLLVLLAGPVAFPQLNKAHLPDAFLPAWMFTCAAVGAWGGGLALFRSRGGTLDRLRCRCRIREGACQERPLIQ